MRTRAGPLHELLYRLAEGVRRHEHAHKALATAATASRHRILPLGCDPIDAESVDAAARPTRGAPRPPWTHCGPSLRNSSRTPTS